MGRAPSSLILTGMLFGMFPLQSLLVVVVGEEEGVAGALEEEGGEALDDSAELPSKPFLLLFRSSTLRGNSYLLYWHILCSLPIYLIPSSCGGHYT